MLHISYNKAKSRPIDARIAQSCPELHWKESPGRFPTYFSILVTFAPFKKTFYHTTDRQTDRQTDRRAHPLIEMRGRI